MVWNFPIFLIAKMIMHSCIGRYNGIEGLHTSVTEFTKDDDCLVCGPGVSMELDSCVTLQKVCPLEMPYLR